jgi:mannan endo-1,4-beta-mannosidase
MRAISFLQKSRCLVILFLGILSSCNQAEEKTANNNTDEYSTQGSRILKNKQAIQLIGTNSFQVFSANDQTMKSWNMDIAREFIGNVLEQPLTGIPIKDSNNSFLHSLQNVVDGNRKNNRITILCGFGWNGKTETEFTGKSPTQTFWWEAYKEKLKEWALHFKNQPDVWLEVWNEPYRFDRADGYTDIVWENDMNTLVRIIRSTGNNSIVIVPCAEQGQDESVLLQKGAVFLEKNPKIIFDIHAYEKWLLDSDASISNRLDQLKKQKLPIIFGETAPMNAGILMNPTYFLNSIYQRGFSVCAWVWKYDSSDQDALLTAEGLPYDKNNNNWGTTFKNLAALPRTP